MAEQQPRRRHNTNRRKRKSSAAQKSFAIFCIITLLIGVAVCIILFVVAYRNFVPPRVGGDTSPRATASPSPNDENDEDIYQDWEDLEHAFGMITAMNTFEPRTLDILLLEDGSTQRFSVIEASRVSNRQGTTIGFSELSVGQIVDLYFDVESRNLATVSISNNAWEQQQSGNFTINLENETITLGNQTYSYSNQTLVLNQGARIAIDQITTADALTLVGYQNKVWSIRLESNHGFIQFENIDFIIDGTISIGATVFMNLEDEEPIPLPEGMHRLVVEGQNIERLIRYVVIRQGETAVIDLSELELRHGTIQVITNVQSPAVFIDGSPVALDNTLLGLEFGTYTIRVEHPGYIAIEHSFVLDQTLLRLEFTLEADVPGRNIAIDTIPTNAQIFVDGVFIGNSPLVVRVEFGNRTIVARMEGYEDRPLHFIADENSPAQYFLPLEPVWQPPVHGTPDHDEWWYDND